MSSSRRVPRPTSANLPSRSRSAPVKAPRTWPNISLSIRLSDSEPQLIVRNGSSHRGRQFMNQPGQARFAGAGLAAEQHGGTQRSDFADLLHQPAHFRIRSVKEWVHLAQRLDTQLALTLLLKQNARIQRVRIDRQGQAMQVERTGEVVGHAGAEQLQLLLGIVAVANDHDGHFASCGLETSNRAVRSSVLTAWSNTKPTSPRRAR